MTAFYPPVPPVALRKESVDRNLFSGAHDKITIRSLSARRAWIEMAQSASRSPATWSLSARRAWIEISAWGRPAPGAECRSPQGERGSKSRSLSAGGKCKPSLSARRAWIEMLNHSANCSRVEPSLSARRAWIEMPRLQKSSGVLRRRSPQGERG